MAILLSGLLRRLLNCLKAYINIYKSVTVHNAYVLYLVKIIVKSVVAILIQLFKIKPSQVSPRYHSEFLFLHYKRIFYIRINGIIFLLLSKYILIQLFKIKPTQVSPRYHSGFLFLHYIRIFYIRNSGMIFFYCCQNIS